MNTETSSEWWHPLADLEPCDDAVEWARTYPTAQAAWDACERGDWMLWILGRLSGEPGSDARRRLVLCAVECAALAPAAKLPSVEEARQTCLRTAAAWARGTAGIQQLRSAADAAYDAATAASCTSDADAAHASDASAGCAYAYATHGDVAKAAANAAADAASAYAADANATAQILMRAADIVRRHYPAPPDLSRVTDVP